MTKLENLLERAKNDESAFRELYDDTVDRVFNYVLVRVRNREDAKEVVQEIYLSLFSSLPKFTYQGDPHFYGFLWTVVRRRIFKRRLKRIQELPFEEIYDYASDEGPPEDYRYLFEALKSLQERERLVLELRYFSHYSFAEIALAHNISETNAKVIHHRALAKLKKQLHDYV